ncbi:RDD family protein [Vibrio mytili]|mgnify:CR=1 FL=1|uniref:RDD domain-containing protein n=1 Tax=Vibrio mytili TaxID=50718 RepID=A0A0C3HPB5_9VIBR|nr:RDD family protein [Vibrio mytili]KIN09981.1 hypothetical protein SU60_15940 [Vibrio mytili]
MSIGDKFRRTGAFVIDLMIAKMFTQVVLTVLALLISSIWSTGLEGFSLNDDIALPILLALVLGMLLVFIGVYLGYCAICFKLLGKSLGKYLLQVNSSNNEVHRNLSAYLSREREKMVYVLATLGLYAAYSAIQFYMYDREPLHEIHSRQ